MKKLIRILLITTIAVLALCCVAMAVEADPPYTEVAAGVNAEITLSGEKVNATYNDAAIVSGGQYMFFLVKENQSGAYIPGETTILYMNQVGASANGTVSIADMFPSKLDDCAVMISGTGLAAPKVIGYIVVPEPPYTLGDVDGINGINSTDAVYALQHSVQLITLTETQLLAADVDKSGVVNSTDAVNILQYSVGLINDWDV